MENNKLIAQALLEIAKERSVTTFIEVGKEDKELIEAAKKIGIVLPSPDLAIMKTVYAEIDKVNKNGVILPRKAVEKGLPTLIGKQVNWEHEGSGRVCGYTISTKINGDEVEEINVIFKSLFPEEMTILKERFTKKELAVSFEIWNKNEEGKSVVHELANGQRSIDPIIFHGTGLLLANKPACPKAIVYKLLASKELENAEKIVEKIFEEDLICASMAIEEPKCNNCGKCKCGKEVKIIIKQIESKEWICPYCEKVIGEKELFCDENQKWYHRPCQEKGEIILPKDNEKEEIKLADEVKNLFLLEIATDNVIELTEEEINSFEDEYVESEIEEAKRLTYEQKKNLSDDDFAVVITVKNKVTGEPRKIRMFVINDEAHVRNALARLGQVKVQETLKRLGVSVETVKNKILKRAKELNMKDLLERYNKSQETPEPVKVEPPAQVAEVKPEPAQVAEAPAEVKLVKMVSEESVVITYTPKADGTGNDQERKGHRKTTRFYSDGKQEVSEEDYEVKDSYTFAQMEEKVNEAIDTLIAALPEEVTTCVKGKIKDGSKPADAVKECWKEYKEKQSKAMADVAGEKETEISNLKKELDAKAQEIAELKKPKVVEAKEEPTVEVGNTEVKEKDKYKERRKKINVKAYGHENEGN